MDLVSPRTATAWKRETLNINTFSHLLEPCHLTTPHHGQAWKFFLSDGGLWIYSNWFLWAYFQVARLEEQLEEKSQRIQKLEEQLSLQQDYEEVKRELQ